MATKDIASRFRSSNPWVNVLADLSEPIAQAGGKYIKDKGQEFLGNFLTKSRDFGREAVYDALTDPIRGQVRDDPDIDYRKDPAFNTPGGKAKAKVREPVSVAAGETAWNAPEYDPHEGRLRGYATKKAPEGNRFLEAVYNNPESIASVAGVATPAAIIGGTGFAANAILNSKPKSEYSVPVQPSAAQGGYNPSVESALASASAKYEIMQQKHANDMELQRLRQEAGRPGSSSGGSSSPYTSASDPGDPFGSELGSSPSLFGGDSGYRRPQRSSSDSSSSYGYMG